MIDFQNAKFIKLRPVSDKSFEKMVAPLLVQGEVILCSFQGIRDGVVFTNMRMIAINVQGLTGKKKDFTSLPYKKIQAFSVETPGVFDLDSELELWFSGMGRLRFDFAANADTAAICRAISTYAL